MSIFNKPQQKPMPTFSTSQTVLPSAAISRIESGSLAELNVPNLMLKKGEKCCFVDKSYEMVETTNTKYPEIRRHQYAKRLFQRSTVSHGQQRICPCDRDQGGLHTGIPLYYQQTYYFHPQKGGLEKSIGSLSAFHPYSNAIGFQFGQKVINFILPRADLAVQTLQIMT